MEDIKDIYADRFIYTVRWIIAHKCSTDPNFFDRQNILIPDKLYFFI